jgi:hypothetical protein
LLLERVKSQPASNASRKGGSGFYGFLHTCAYQTPARPGASIIWRQICKAHTYSPDLYRNLNLIRGDYIKRKITITDGNPLPACQSARAFSLSGHAILRTVARGFRKKTPKQVAADLGLSLSMVYKWAEPPNHASGSGTGNPLDRIEALLTSTGDHRLVQWICQRAGRFFHPQPKNTPHPHYLIPATNQIVQEFADLLHVIATATADDKITRRRPNKSAPAGRN